MVHETFTESRNDKKAKTSWENGTAFGPESNNRKLVSALLSQADRIDRDLEDIVESSHIDTATGERLEQFGALIPLKRLENESDSKYRTRIKAEIAQARTNTDFNDFIEFISAVISVPQSNIILYTNYDALPAVVILRTQKSVFENAELTNAEAVNIIEEGVPAGHEVQIEVSGTFTLTDDAETNTAENGLTSDTISTGGTLGADLL